MSYERLAMSRESDKRQAASNKPERAATSYERRAVSREQQRQATSGKRQAGKEPWERRTMQNFRNLQVWQRAHQLTLAVYRFSDGFPSREMYGLTNQLRRSCSSIEANIAEGCGRRSDAELARFLRIAMGSATETECHLLIAHDLGFGSGDQYRPVERLLEEVKRMLHAFLETVESGRQSGRDHSGAATTVVG
jgi:four helix bundle protein